MEQSVHTPGQAPPHETPRADRADSASLPRPVQVMILQRWVPTFAHAVRVTRRGHQTLVSLSGQLLWIPSNRVAERCTRLGPVGGAAVPEDDDSVPSGSVAEDVA